MNKVTLVIDKKKIEFHLGVGFLGELLEEQGCDITEMFKRIGNNIYKNLPILMESSARYALYRKGKEAKYKLEDFLDMIDNEGLNSPVLIDFMRHFNNSVNKDVPVDNDNDSNDDAEPAGK